MKKFNKDLIKDESVKDYYFNGKAYTEEELGNLWNFTATQAVNIAADGVNLSDPGMMGESIYPRIHGVVTQEAYPNFPINLNDE